MGINVISKTKKAYIVCRERIQTYSCRLWLEARFCPRGTMYLELCEAPYRVLKC